MRTFYMEGLSSEGFEQMCEEIFSAFFKSKTKRSFMNDISKTDFLILSKDNIAVDCVHPARAAVGRPTVERLYLVMKQKKVKEGIIVTSGRFASTAQKHVDENDLPITLMDLEKLAAMALKAGIKLVYKKEEPDAYTIISNSDREFSAHLAGRLEKELQCSEEIGLNLAILKRNITMQLFYKINYAVNSEFVVSGNVIHKEKGEGYFYISEKTGKIEGDDFAKVYDMVPKMAYAHEGKEVDLMKPSKQILSTVYSNVQSAHTKYVPYKTRSEKLSEKKCVPSKNDISVQNIMCLYLPFSDVDYELFKKSRNIKSLETSSADFFVFEPKNLSCDICGGKIEKDGIVCVSCGCIADDKHGVRCSRCNKTLCTNCALFISKFLGKKEPICAACANKEPDAKIKSKSELSVTGTIKNLLKQ